MTEKFLNLQKKTDTGTGHPEDFKWNEFKLH